MTLITNTKRSIVLLVLALGIVLAALAAGVVQAQPAHAAYLSHPPDPCLKAA